MTREEIIDNEPKPSAVKAADGEEVFNVEFRGTAREYFRIWLVNMLLTIITVGVYSAWAKVRNKRYFYGNTRIGGANFEYHARPLQILVSRLIVFSLLAGGVYLAGQGVALDAYLTLGLILFLPWALVRGLSFNARNSSWSGMHFSFVRNYKTVYLIATPVVFCYTIPVVNISGGFLSAQQLYAVFLIAFSLLMLMSPLMLRAYHRYKAGQHRIGELRFYLLPISKRAYYNLMAFGAPILGTLLAMLVMLILGPIISVLANTGELINTAAGAEIFGGLVGVLSVIFTSLFMQAALFRMFWSKLRASNGARFVCDVRFAKFAGILLVNFLATVLSLGLLYPWAKVRKTRYLAENMRLIVPEGKMAELTAPSGESESALGAELDAAEGFDFDIALV